MNFIADLHLHSHFSRATAKNLDLENLYTAAQLKGITLVGTGDFTHPGWLSEIREKLEPAEPGLLCLKSDLAKTLDAALPPSCRGPVRFILQAEISSIYKRGGKVRKNHNLIFLSDTASVEALNARLSAIGNLTSDGRPILGLDSEKLLDMTLSTSGSGFLVPAHIWTPWFSLFGSKSGFDSVEECFGKLSKHIFAAETGLSSDPPMNWRISGLDTIRLISNSDAHSPMMMGRNATAFNTELSFDHVRKALETGDAEAFQGTIDMFPEEGKYHFDGHRKCGVCMSPSQTLAHDCICPRCGKPLTLGVLFRVNQLASRPEGFVPQGRHGYKSIVPLKDILAEIAGTGPGSKKVESMYARTLDNLGPELGILLQTDIHDMDQVGIPLLSEAIKRMRSGLVDIAPGFDGEYGKVRIFSPEDRQRLMGEQELFSSLAAPPRPGRPHQRARKNPEPGTMITAGSASQPSASGKTYTTLTDPVQKAAATLPTQAGDDLLASLNPAQRAALSCTRRPLLIQAGPGTGKTRTLTAKIAHLILEKGIAPQSILALTFTNRAAEEMKERLRAGLPPGDGQVQAMTFHAFCLMILKDYAGFGCTVVDEILRRDILDQAAADIKRNSDNLPHLATTRIARYISLAKQQGPDPAGAITSISDPKDTHRTLRVLNRYQELLACQNLVDFDDLIVRALSLLETDPALLATVRKRFRYLFVDEYQDINKGQYLLTRLLADKGERLFVIGDPDQSIYGFRGSDNRYFTAFFSDYPLAEKIILKQNYRSTGTILEASFQLISRGSDNQAREKLFSDIQGNQRLLILESATDVAEAVAIGKRIERLMGGISLFSMDTGKADGVQDTGYSFSDFAILYRTRKQCRIFAEVFDKAGIPFQTADKESVFLEPGIRELLALARVSLGTGTFHDLEAALSWLKILSGPGEQKVLRTWYYSQGIPLGSVRDRLEHTPPAGLSPPVLAALGAALHKTGSLGLELAGIPAGEALETLAGTFGITRSLKTSKKGQSLLDQLILTASMNGTTLPFFLESMALRTDTESLIPDSEKVSLMTIHAAKGLEFPIVFVTGCEDGLIPFSYPGAESVNLDEERRLFYVALTRARELLCLTYARKRRIFNQMVQTRKSPFLDDIEDTIKEHGQSKKKVRPVPKRERQLDLFE
ncbi:MAG: UvrD-helicase domain-containing protein [Pseudomonadota bacterium]